MFFMLMRLLRMISRSSMRRRGSINAMDGVIMMLLMLRWQRGNAGSRSTPRNSDEDGGFG
jgi:hypothetical protein